MEDTPEEVDGAAGDGRSEDDDCQHPGVATLAAIDEPAGELACGLDDQQGAEAFAELEYWRGKAQDLVPGADCKGFEQAIGAEKPFRVGMMCFFLFWKERTSYPAAVVVRINGKLAQGPN